jgi:hypothetical protein
VHRPGVVRLCIMWANGRAHTHPDGHAMHATKVHVTCHTYISLSSKISPNMLFCDRTSRMSDPNLLAF